MKNFYEFEKSVSSQKILDFTEDYTLIKSDNYYIIHNSDSCEIAKMHFILKNDVIVLWHNLTHKWNSNI